MRVRGTVGVSALVLAGFVTAASSIGGVFEAPPTESASAAATHDLDPTTEPPAAQAALIPTVGLVPAAPRPERQLRTAKPAATPTIPDPASLLPGAAPRSVPVPVVVGPLGIPEIVLDAYRSPSSTMASTSRVADCSGTSSPASGRSSPATRVAAAPTRPAPRSHRSSAPSSTDAWPATRSSPTPIAARSTVTDARPRRRADAVHSEHLARATRRTATATASPTRTMSSTPPSRRRSTCARAASI